METIYLVTVSCPAKALRASSATISSNLISTNCGYKRPVYVKLGIRYRGGEQDTFWPGSLPVGRQGKAGA